MFRRVLMNIPCVIVWFVCAMKYYQFIDNLKLQETWLQNCIVGNTKRYSVSFTSSRYVSVYWYESVVSRLICIMPCPRVSNFLSLVSYIRQLLCHIKLVSTIFPTSNKCICIYIYSIYSWTWYINFQLLTNV